jgi:hypothetical protein
MNTVIVVVVMSLGGLVSCAGLAAAQDRDYVSRAEFEDRMKALEDKIKAQGKKLDRILTLLQKQPVAASARLKKPQPSAVYQPGRIYSPAKPNGSGSNDWERERQLKAKFDATGYLTPAELQEKIRLASRRIIIR